MTRDAQQHGASARGNDSAAADAQGESTTTRNDPAFRPRELRINGSLPRATHTSAFDFGQRIGPVNGGPTPSVG